MSSINYLKKTALLKAMNLKKFPAFIVAALLLLLVAGVQSQTVAKSPVPGVFNIAEAPTINILQAADPDFVVNTRITSNYRMDKLFPSAEVVTAKSFVSHAGLPQEKHCFCRLSRKMETTLVHI